MGGSIVQVIVGGAALDADIHEFMQVWMGVPVRTGYGLTEAGSDNVILPMSIRAIKPGTVGGHLVNVEVWLEPIPGYDNQNAGEIVIRRTPVTSGYSYDDAASRELSFDEVHSAIRTGDVGKWDADGYLQVINRIRSIFKLSQCEYVSAELVTQVFETSALVRQIFTYRDNKRTCLVAAVVPERVEIARLEGKATISDTELADMCRSEDLKKAVLKQLAAVRKGRAMGFQIVKAVYLEPQEWTTDNECLTPTFKLKRKRKKLTEKYREIIE
jgi:long-chain acyl-CoA synthetase